MNPFATPDKIFISRSPQDMRAGIQRLASIITTDFGRDPMDGALYAFVSRDCQKVKLLRFDVNGWCMCPAPVFSTNLNVSPYAATVCIAGGL